MFDKSALRSIHQKISIEAGIRVYKYYVSKLAPISISEKHCVLNSSIPYKVIERTISHMNR